MVREEVMVVDVHPAHHVCLLGKKRARWPVDRNLLLPEGVRVADVLVEEGVIGINTYHLPGGLLDQGCDRSATEPAVLECVQAMADAVPAAETVAAGCNMANILGGRGADEAVNMLSNGIVGCVSVEGWSAHGGRTEPSTRAIHLGATDHGTCRLWWRNREPWRRFIALCNLWEDLQRGRSRLWVCVCVV